MTDGFLDVLVRNAAVEVDNIDGDKHEAVIKRAQSRVPVLDHTKDMSGVLDITRQLGDERAEPMVDQFRECFGRASDTRYNGTSWRVHVGLVDLWDVVEDVWPHIVRVQTCPLVCVLVDVAFSLSMSLFNAEVMFGVGSLGTVV